MVSLKLSSLSTNSSKELEHKAKFDLICEILAITLKKEVDDINIWFNIKEYIKTNELFIEFCFVIKKHVYPNIDCKCLYRMFEENCLTSSFIGYIIKKN